MVETRQRHVTPKRILLATDLSGRCDRALDRAVLLAVEWQATLVVVHALEPDYRSITEAEQEVPSWRRSAARRMVIAKRQVREDLCGRDVPFEIVIEEGEPSEVVLKAAAERGCDLIVTGTARNETFGRLVLGTTVDRLVRRAPVPVLVVKARARRPYARIAVATDFSDVSRHALEGAAALFPAASIALLHGYRPDTVGVADSRAGEEAGRHAAADACAGFLAATALAPERRRALEIVMESSDIELIVRSFAEDKGIDLLAIGARGRNPLLELLLGSTAERLLRSAPCDVLVMRKT